MRLQDAILSVTGRPSEFIRRGSVGESEGAPGRWATIGGNRVWLPGSRVTRLCKPEEGIVYEIQCDDEGAEAEVVYRKPSEGGRGYERQSVARLPSYEAGCSFATWHSKIVKAASGRTDESIAREMRQLVLELCSNPYASRVMEAEADVAMDYADRVDEAANVIRGVKLLGIESRNTARVLGLDPVRYGAALERPYGYTPDGLRAALPLYEGSAIYLDHRPFEFDQTGARIIKSGERSANDLLGAARNVRFIDGHGLYGDFHYLAAHPFAPRLVEAARRFPTKLAFSHEAGYDEPILRDGKVFLSRITDVDGIALIASKPGTTSGLFESLRS